MHSEQSVLFVSGISCEKETVGNGGYLTTWRVSMLSMGIYP